MKKFLLIAAAVLMGTSAFADSYTITFKDNGTDSDNSANIKAGDPVSTFIASDTTYVTEGYPGPAGTTTKAYVARIGRGLKFGSSSAPGNLVVKLAPKACVNADSIRVKAMKYSDSEEVNLQINNGSVALRSKSMEDYTITFAEPQAIDTLYFTSDGKRFYAAEVEVFYTPAPGINFDTALCYSPNQKYPGTDHQVILGADLLTKKENADGALKPAINDTNIKWAVYTNPTASVADGTSEVSVSNVYTSFDAFTGDTIETASNMKMLSCSDGNWIGFPKIEAQKTMDLYIKDTKKLTLILTGAGSSETENVADITIAAFGAAYADVYTTRAMPGKSQKQAFYDATAYNNKCVASYKFEKELDPTQCYKITLKAHNESTGTVSFVSAFLNDTLDTVAPTAYVTATPTSAYWQVVLGPDMITDTKTINGEVANKHAIDDVNYPWISYSRSDGTPFDDGTPEVQGAARYVTIDPITGDTCAAFAVQGYNGLWNDPVVDKDKTLHFRVSGTTNYRVYATGSAGSTSKMVVTVNPVSVQDVPQVINSNDITGKSNKADGSASNPTYVDVTLNPGLMYNIDVCSDNNSLAVYGINLSDKNTEANKAANKGTLNIAIDNAATVDGVKTITLAKGETYTLNGAANLERVKTIINGDNTGVKADSCGQIVLKNSVVLNGLNFNCADSKVAPVAMAAKSTLTLADSLALYTVVPDTIKSLVNGADSLYIFGDSMRFANAANKVFEAEGIEINNCNFAKVGTPLVNGNDAPWAARTLKISNTNAEFTYNSGKAVIDWEEGASQIKDITIENSTLYADSTNTAQRFHRYSSQVDPWRVWGYDGENKNAPDMNTWTLTNNTFVNLCANKEFSNNIKNTAATSFTFTGNVFANCWRLQKLGSNVTRYFTAADNVICGGMNAVDGTDASKWATEDADMAVTATSLKPCPYSLTASLQYGDPDNLVAYVALDSAAYEFNTETEGAWYFQAVFANADSVVVADNAAIKIMTTDSTTVFTVTPQLMQVTADTVTVNLPAMASAFIAPGDYIICIPEAAFTLRGAADNYEHAAVNADYDLNVTIQAPVAIEKLEEETENNAVLYNVAGQRVNKANGIVVKNGKVMMVK